MKTTKNMLLMEATILETGKKKTVPFAFIAEILNEGDKVSYVCVGRNIYAELCIFAADEILSGKEIKKKEIKTSFAKYYKAEMRVKKAQKEFRDSQYEFGDAKKSLIGLLQNISPTIEGLQKSLSYRNDWIVRSYSTTSEGTLTLSKERDLGNYCYSLVEVLDGCEPRLKVSEENLYKKYAYLKKDKSAFKDLKNIKLEKVDFSWEAGGKTSLSVYTDYTFKIKLTEKNVGKVKDELQWVIDNL